MDAIHIKGLRVFAFHGVNPSEKEKGQPFVLDITLRADLSAAGASDALADTVNYASVVKLAQVVMASQKDNLLERAATRLAQSLLSSFPVLSSVCVTLKKPRAPIAADFEYVACEINLSRTED